MLKFNDFKSKQNGFGGFKIDKSQTKSVNDHYAITANTMTCGKN